MARYRLLLILCLLVPLRAWDESRNPPPAEQAQGRTRYESMLRRFGDLKQKYDAQLKRVQDVERRNAIVPNYCNGRLSTQSNVAVSTASRAAQSNLRFVPYHGNRITLYTAGVWRMHTFTQRTLTLSGLTTDTNYDVWLYNNAGTLTLELSAAWSNATTRSQALAVQDGIYVKSGDLTRRYVGTIRASSATTTEDSNTQRFVWNHCNRVKRTLLIQDVTNTWASTTTTWELTNPALGTPNTLGVVIGLNESFVHLRSNQISGTAGSLAWVSSGFGVDSTTTNSAQLMGGTSGSTATVQIWSEYNGYPGVGYHALNWLETTDGTSVTFYGDNNSARLRSGVLGWVES